MVHVVQILGSLAVQYETCFDEEVSGEGVAAGLVDRAEGITEASSISWTLSLRLQNIRSDLVSVMPPLLTR
jgi:hypothetical protein